MTPSGVDGDLPFVDEHRVSVAAGPAEVWARLGRTLAGMQSASRLVGPMLGTDPARATGDPLVEGSTLVGFAVRRAVADTELVLAGRHRFSRYALVFVLEQRDAHTVLAARTYAVFPGALGAAYRCAVLGTGGHRFATRRLLRSVRDAG